MKEELEKLLRDYKIQGISFDSRVSKEGDLFFALKGSNTDGSSFIGDAIARGACLIITDNAVESYDADIKDNFPQILYMHNAREALAVAAGIMYPRVPEHLIAVTGTNGKTSIVSYIQQLLELLGTRSASIGTLGVVCSTPIEVDIAPGNLTTLDSVSFRRVLDSLASNDVNHVAFEASSHGLAQGRLKGVKVDVAAFASFSQDHLDYHITMENYLESKLKLFSENLSAKGIAILNNDMDNIDVVTEYLDKNNKKYYKVGTTLGSDLYISKITHSLNGQVVSFNFKGSSYEFTTNIIGSFQATNLLIAIMAVHHLGFDFSVIIDKLQKLVAVKGRFERVTNIKSGIQVFVDYAHTPDALEKALTELQLVKSDGSKLIVVFGCGGNRDVKKRAIMGKIASTLADTVIVTDDNPRYEDPASIRLEIISGIDAKNSFIEIGNREEAINKAINLANRNDIVLIAGKGHENYQIIKDSRTHFSDSEVAKKAMAKKNIRY